MQGLFVISLDFELHWGNFDKLPLNRKAKCYFSNTRDIIPKKLALFREYEIHATWATVGMLFRKNVDEWYYSVPASLPSYYNSRLSSYEWVHRHGFEGAQDPFHFAPDLIDLISSTPWQEIGSHTYSHYYCLEPGQTEDQFRKDLKAAIEAAQKIGITIHSLVFPRNQFNAHYLSVCAELGISVVRSNPDTWYWHASENWNLFRKIFRTADAYVSLPPRKSIDIASIQHESPVVLLPASRFYRPWQPGHYWLNTLKLKRILNEMTFAAMNGHYYHLWWHPHNLGHQPAQSMRELTIILEHYRGLHRKYSFKSLTMSESVNYLNGTGSAQA